MIQLAHIVMPLLLVGQTGSFDGVDRVPTGGKNIPKADLDRIDVAEHLGETLELDGLRFTDQMGKEVALSTFFDGERPVLLTLNYFRCTTLCSTQLNQLLKALKKMELVPGRDFRLVTASFDPEDRVEVAAGKRQSYLDAYGHQDEGADWTFLTSAGDATRRLADQLGFKYFYDEEHKQFAHTTVLFFLSPEAKISRYIYGITYEPRDLKFALIDASEGRIGATVDKILLSCFQFDSSSGTYGATAFGVMRLGGVLMLLVMGLGLGTLWLRERRRKRRDESGESGESETLQEVHS